MTKKGGKMSTGMIDYEKAFEQCQEEKDHLLDEVEILKAKLASLLDDTVDDRDVGQVMMDTMRKAGTELSGLDFGDVKIKDVKEFSDLTGLTMVKVVGEVGDDEIKFLTSDGRCFKLYHEQDCCENVTVEDICGDLQNLVGHPILRASEQTSGENPEGVTKEFQDSFTWTFYEIATIKGSVTIRWYGESNGYYSERVSFEEATAKW